MSEGRSGGGGQGSDRQSAGRRRSAVCAARVSRTFSTHLTNAVDESEWHLLLRCALACVPTGTVLVLNRRTGQPCTRADVCVCLCVCVRLVSRNFSSKFAVAVTAGGACEVFLDR